MTCASLSPHSSSGSANKGGGGGEVGLGDLQFGALEVDVGDAVQWDEVHVSVRDLEADDGHADAFAGDGALELQCHMAGEEVDAG